MIAVIGAVVQLILLILGKWLEVDAADKAKKAQLIKELGDAIKTGDVSTINILLSRVR